MVSSFLIKKNMKKVLILGSGALKIGEAGEFDYSGSQAIKALKEEGIKTILINPNIATIQTSEFLADEVYFLPINPYFVEQVIKKEKPSGILLSFGGQTALNCGVALYKSGVLKKYQLEVLGTPVRSIILTEDRALFANHLTKIGQPIAPSFAVETISQAKKKAKIVGYPVMVRAAYALGGQKSGVAYNEKKLEAIVGTALKFTPQVLIEKYLKHYKEVEYEIVRDQDDNCIAVCNMENFDPMGIHTGESIVVAPSQTLTNFEYHYLRQAGIKIVRSFNIVGECNVQFALNPNPKSQIINHKSQINSKSQIQNPKRLEFENSDLFGACNLGFDAYSIEYYVIELNARLSRSSALASKATGYPLAYVAAKLTLGKKLTKIKNQVTQVTQSCFEPALDYIVAKIPRWDLAKFKGVTERIGSSMKSVGEVMAIGRTFEEAIQKGVRMLDIGVEGVTDNGIGLSKKEVLKNIEVANSKRIFFISAALRMGVTIKEIYQLSGIDPWFLSRIKNIVETEEGFKKDKKLTEKNLLNFKKLGFSDKKIGNLLGVRELEVRRLRKKLKITPSVFKIDTLAAEFPVKTNYLYTTYNGSHHDVQPLGRSAVIVLGSGPYRIGSSVEFDWTCVNTALKLKKHQKKSIIINCNPETVSTDYDISNRLYFEELSFERVADIFEFERSEGLILSVGGQTPNNIAKKVDSYGIKIYGTNAKSIDKAEDRKKFSHLLDSLAINQPAWDSFTTINSGLRFCEKVGYPVLIRPSYVLSGSAMSLCYSASELMFFIKKATLISREYPVTISKFITNAREIEFDGVAQDGELKIYALANHIEYAGVHSGDATIVYPAEKVTYLTGKRIIEVAEKLAKLLEITGPFNIQFMAKNNQVSVIEMNLRASRTFPFISKVIGINFAEVLVDSFFGKAKTYSLSQPKFIGVKTPQFSFARLEGADPVLRVEMASTGEVACFGETAEEAYYKALISTGFSLKNKTALITVGGEENKLKIAESIWRLKNLGFKLYATEKTHRFFKDKGVETELVYKVYEKKTPTVVDIIKNNRVALVVNISDHEEKERVFKKVITDGFMIRRAAIDNNISLLTDFNLARFFVNALVRYQLKDLQVKSWKEYLKK